MAKAMVIGCLYFIRFHSRPKICIWCGRNGLCMTPLQPVMKGMDLGSVFLAIQMHLTGGNNCSMMFGWWFGTSILFSSTVNCIVCWWYQWYPHWLVVWLPCLAFSHILGISSSQLTKSNLFQRVFSPTTNQEDPRGPKYVENHWWNPRNII